MPEDRPVLHEAVPQEHFLPAHDVVAREDDLAVRIDDLRGDRRLLGVRAVGKQPEDEEAEEDDECDGLDPALRDEQLALRTSVGIGRRVSTHTRLCRREVACLQRSPSEDCLMPPPGSGRLPPESTAHAASVKSKPTEGRSASAARHVPELVRVEDRPDRDDDAVGDLERRHPECAAVRLVEHEAGLPVDERRPVHDPALAPAGPSR